MFPGQYDEFVQGEDCMQISTDEVINESVGEPLLRLRRRLASRESPPQSFHLATQDGRSPQTGIWFDFSRPHYKDIISVGCSAMRRALDKLGGWQRQAEHPTTTSLSVCLLTRP